jgi:hypothetical protein
MTVPPGYALEFLRESADFTLYRGQQPGNPCPNLQVPRSEESKNHLICYLRFR